jgi:UDP-N-acetylmuramoyl-tripeptide--D-alanyl-D-alanine ligase
MSLWTSRDIAAATGGRDYSAATGDGWTAKGVSIDSRTVAAGDLFIAIEGPTHDGHHWVADALAKGAAGAIVHAVPEGCDPARLIVVEDTFAALNALGRAGRARFTGKVVGVTGSVGKTSTKDMLARMLGALGATHAAAGSLNNHWGVPLTLARLPAEAAFAVIEMGMNHPGEIAVLARLARPHVAIVTAVAPAHMEFFPSLDAIADAKAEICQGVEPGGAVVLPADSDHFARLAEAAGRHHLTVLPFGATLPAEATAGGRLLDAAVETDRTLVFAQVDGHALGYTVGAGGRHWALNSLAALTAVQALGGDLALAAATLATMTPPAGRGRPLRVPLADGTLVVIDDAYNANPRSMAAALEALGAARPGRDAAGHAGRRIAVLGDMLELGAEGPAMHRDLAAIAVAQGIDLVFTAGPLMRHAADALPAARRAGHADDSAALAPLVAAAARAGDVITVKGSAGSRMGRIVDALTARARPVPSPDPPAPPAA